MNKTKFKQTEISEVPKDWDVQAIADLPIDIIDGDRGINYPKKNEFEKQGFCLFLNTKNVPGEHFDFSECDFVSEERDQILRKGKLQKGDIILTTRGTVGNIAYYHERIPYEHIRINSGMVIIRNTRKRFDTDYLYHLLKSPILKQQYLSFATGSAQPQLPIRDINKIRLTIPSILEQRAIAKILSDLDGKIELNHQMNRTLESIAQAIFKRWFVDFEFLNEQDKPYRSFGGKVVDSELGEVPEAWEIKPLDQIAEFLNGLALQKYPPMGDKYLPVIKIRELNQGITESTDKAAVDVEKKYIVDDGDVLFSWSGSLQVCIWCNGKGALNQHLFKVTSDHYPKWFYYQWVKFHLPEFRQIAQGKATTMGHIQRRHLSASLVTVPPYEVLEKMNRVMEPLLDQIVVNGIEIRKLSEIRDSILPKLMSGKIRIN